MPLRTAYVGMDAICFPELCTLVWWKSSCVCTCSIEDVEDFCVSGDHKIIFGGGFYDSQMWVSRNGIDWHLSKDPSGSSRCLTSFVIEGDNLSFLRIDAISSKCCM